MPLINGVCIPMICLRITFNTAAAAIDVFDTRRNRVDPARSAAAALAHANRLAAVVAQLRNPVVQPCDGCQCWRPVNPPPAVALQPLIQPAPISTPRFQVRIVGILYVQEVGLCLPPGARILPGPQPWERVDGCGCGDHEDCRCEETPGGHKKGGKKGRKTKPGKRGRR